MLILYYIASMTNAYSILDTVLADFYALMTSFNPHDNPMRRFVG